MGKRMRIPGWLTSVKARPLYLWLAAALVVVAAWGAWPRALPVETSTLARAPLVVGFSEEGRTRLRDRYLVSAPLDGVVQRIELEPGDAVKAGAPVASVRPAYSALFDPANRAQAEARWHAAGDELTAATSEAAAAKALRDRLDAARQRAESLAAQRLIASDQLDEARAQATYASASFRSAEARARAARIQRDSARAVLDLQGSATRDRASTLALPAPVDGRVIRRHVESEGFVRVGQPLLEIGDPQAIEVIVETLTADATQVMPGTPVRLLRWGGDAALRARVLRVEPGGFTKVSALGVEEQRVLVVVRIEDGQAYKPLGDGFRVEAEFQVWGADSVLIVPTAALLRDGPHWAVYAVEDGRARLRRLRIDHVGTDAAEVVSGLGEGARVVLYPGDSLREGMRVRDQRE